MKINYKGLQSGLNRNSNFSNFGNKEKGLEFRLMFKLAQFIICVNSIHIQISTDCRDYKTQTNGKLIGIQDNI